MKQFKGKILMRGTWGLSIAAALAFSVMAGTDGDRAEAKDVGEDNGMVFDVTDYGANGSDKKDDTDAINAALKEAADRDGHITVKIPAGTYYIGSPSDSNEVQLRIYSDTSIIADEGAVIKSTNNKASSNTVDNQKAMVAAIHLNDDGSVCYGKNDCTHRGNSQIQNVTISGGVWDRNDKKGNQYNAVFRFYHGKNITIKDLTVKNCSYHFFNLSGVDTALIENVTFMDQAAYKGKDSQFWQGRVGDEERYNSMEAIHLDFTDDAGFPLDNTASDNITIKNCTFKNIYAGLGTHHDTKKTNAKNLKVIGNKFENVKGNCINAYTFDNITVKNNKVKNCRDFVYAQHSKAGVIEGNTVYKISRFGINLNGCRKYKIKSNKIEYAPKNGVTRLIRSEDSDSVIENNILSKSYDYGIYITGGKAKVIGNTVKDNKTDGIRACEGTVITFKNNKISGSGRYGIAVNDLGSGNVIEGNKVTGGNEGGIYIRSVKKCAVKGNEVTGSKGHGIYARGTQEAKTTLIVENNRLKTASGEMRDLCFGTYCVNCTVKNNKWSGRGFFADLGVSYTESGNKVVY